ncbi:MAG: polysaccharide biosynthesis C-terminal domain-containing protein, partial [Candidatus Sumerlaeota bacterium]|nr:polysaccharide biosynthesis C-terminal domain-containing protein [Candidatus Sumerlaeota bacterium]
RIMLYKYLSVDAVGQYAVPARIMYCLVDAIWVPISYLVLPVLSRSYQLSYRHMIRTALKYAAPMVALYIAACGGLSIVSGRVIGLLWGAAYLPGASCLPILIWSSLFFACTSFMYRILIVMNRQAHYIIVLLLTSGLNVALNLWLIPRYGIIGAAWAILGSSGAGSVACAAVLYKISAAALISTNGPDAAVRSTTQPELHDNASLTTPP